MSFITLIQIIVSIALIVVVVIQNQGGGLGGAFGGGGSFHTRRGVEKTIFYATIVISVIFTITSVVSLLSV